MDDETADTAGIQRNAAPRCIGVKRDGAPCNAAALGGSAYCLVHDPSRVVEMAAWRREGGRSKSNAARARKTLAASTLSAEELDAVLCSVLAKVVKEQVPPAVGTSAAAIVKALISVREAGQIADRLTDVERLIKGATS